MPISTGFRICLGSYVCQNSEYGKVLYGRVLKCKCYAASEYARICLGRVLNIYSVLNMPGF